MTSLNACLRYDYYKHAFHGLQKALNDRNSLSFVPQDRRNDTARLRLLDVIHIKESTFCAFIWTGSK